MRVPLVLTGYEHDLDGGFRLGFRRLVEVMIAPESSRPAVTSAVARPRQLIHDGRQCSTRHCRCYALAYLDRTWLTRCARSRRKSGLSMSRNFYLAGTAAMVFALGAAACGHSSDSGTTKTETVTASTSASATIASSSSSAAAAPGGSAGVQSLIPTPASTQRTDGPDSIAENGVHKHFGVNGSPLSVMDAYRAALEAQGWTVSVLNSGGGGGGGATYAGTNGTAYGVFVGGGYGGSTNLDACAWPAKPANPSCGSN